MDIMEMLTGEGTEAGASSIAAIAGSLGLDSTQARAVVEKLVPVLGAGLQTNAASADGLASLGRSLQSGGHGSYLRDPVRLTSTDGINDGNAILGHVLGSKDASRSAAAAAAQSTGVDYDVVKKMLPMVAATVMGALSEKSMAGGASGPGGITDLLGGLLDADKDGSVADDLLGMAGKLFRG